MYIDQENPRGTKNPLKRFIREDADHYHVSLILSIFVLIVLLFETITGETHLRWIQYTLGVFFIIEFVYRSLTSDNKLKYFKQHLFDLILCIPIYPITWYVAFMAFRSLKIILEFVLNKINTAFNAMLYIGIALVSFATISIMQFEILPESNIKTLGDAIWWAMCTITTIGYGDKFPITTEGRIIAGILMVAGIGLFGTLIGYMSSFFTDKEKKNNDHIDTIEELSAQITELKKTIVENKNGI